MPDKQYNYSTDMILKSAFEYELNNLLKLVNIQEGKIAQIAIIDYLERRIKEIKDRYK
jgi:hypothetical protein